MHHQKTRFPNIKLVICSNPEEVAACASNTVLALLKTHPQAVLGFATGNTPVLTYKQLVKDYAENGTNWSQCTTFNLDEYVDFDQTDPRSYHQFMHDKLFAHVNVNPENCHVPEGLGNISENAQNFEKQISAAGGIDLQILGLGANGHIAFNEPGTSFTSRTHLQKLSEQTRHDHAVNFNHDEEVPRSAITMGIGTIMDCRHNLLLATGTAKAPAINALFTSSSPTINWPVTALQNHPKVTVIIDKKAGNLLPFGLTS